MPIFQRGIFQPAQRLASVTLHSDGRDIGRHQVHIDLQLGDDRHAPTFPADGFSLGGQIAHIGDDNMRPPRPPAFHAAFYSNQFQLAESGREMVW